MTKCEVIKEFTLEEFDKLKNIQRKKSDTKGKLYVGDVFECEERMADYLTGNNKNGDIVVKVIEIEPEKTIEEIRKIEPREPLTKKQLEKFSKKFELKPKKKKTSKK